jgi:O-antigen ligase
MIQTLPVRVDSVRAQERVGRRTSTWGFLGVLGAGLLVGLSGFLPRPDLFALSLGVFVCGAVAILVRPISGVYLIAFFAIVGDGTTMAGFPFNLNFSTQTSFLFVHNALTFSPLEVYLGLTAVSWLAHVAGTRSWHRLNRPVSGPVLIFAGFVALGLIYGVGAQGGDLTTAMWEARPLLYLVTMYMLVSNLLTRAAQYVSLAWVVVLAVSIQSLLSLRYYYALSPDRRDVLESLTEHPASVVYAWVLLLTVAACMLRKCSPWTRLLLVLASIPTAYVFVLSERRAAFVALAAGFIAFTIVLFFRRRRAFLVLVPTVLVLFVGYSAVFWNATGGVGFGARAVKTVFSPNEVSERDSASDIYRAIENFDLVSTIRAEPLTGVGFGKPFHQPAPLPDISFFVFFQYIPHNSILWIWLKLGFLGFVSLLFVAAAVLRAGTRASLQVQSGDALAVTVSALAFVVMFFVFAYVDIAFDARACVFLAVCMATCANMLRLSASEEAVPARR